MENNEANNISNAGSWEGLTDQIRRYLPLVQGRDSSITKGI